MSKELVKKMLSGMTEDLKNEFLSQLQKKEPAPNEVDPALIAFVNKSQQKPPTPEEIADKLMGKQ
jgi:tRNA U55 pseudouridine synthase TruB